MNLFEWPLTAGSAKTWYGEGRYLRLLKGDAPVEIEVRYRAGSVLRSKMIVGIGVDLANPADGERFEAITFISEVDQTVGVLVTAFPSADSRLTGDVDINGLLQVVSLGGQSRRLSNVTVPAGAAALLLPATTGRVGALLTWTGTLYAGADATVTDSTGVRIVDGANDENASELWAYNATAADIVVSVLEDLQ